MSIIDDSIKLKLGNLNPTEFAQNPMFDSYKQYESPVLEIDRIKKSGYNTDSTLSKYWDYLSEEKEKFNYFQAQATHDELLNSLRAFYADTDIDPNDEATRIEFANLFSKEYPEYTSKYLYDNMDMFLKYATGYDPKLDGSISSFGTHLSNSFKSATLSIATGFDAFFTLLFNPSGVDAMLERANKTATTYRRDIGDKNFDTIPLLPKMISASVQQLPQFVADFSLATLSWVAPPVAPLAIGARFAMSGLMEAGSTALELLQAGASNETALATSIVVGLINGTLEKVGDDAILKPFQRFLKGNQTVKKYIGDNITEFGLEFVKDAARDTGKALVTENITENTEQFISMMAWNIARSYEQKAGRMEDTLGYTAKDFANSFIETTRETTLSTPLLTLAGDVITYGSSYIGGDWRKAIDASKYTKNTPNSQIFRSKDIVVNDGIQNYISNKKDLKNDKADAIKVVRIGDKFFAVNPTDKQKSALKTSKTVNAEVQNFSATNLVKDIDQAKETDIGVTYGKAIESIEEGFKKGLVAGYSLLDENKKETFSSENAKYIAVVTNSAKDSAAVITLGDNEDAQQSFETKVFGKPFKNVTKKAAPKSSAKSTSTGTTTNANFNQYRKDAEAKRQQDAKNKQTNAEKLKNLSKENANANNSQQASSSQQPNTAQQGATQQTNAPQATAQTASTQKATTTNNTAKPNDNKQTATKTNEKTSNATPTQQPTQATTQTTPTVQTTTQATEQTETQPQATQEPQQAKTPEQKDAERDAKVAEANKKEDKFTETVEKLTPKSVDEVVDIRDKVAAETGDIDKANAIATNIATVASATGESVENVAKANGESVDEVVKSVSSQLNDVQDSLVEGIVKAITNSNSKSLKEKIWTYYKVKSVSNAMPKFKADLKEYYATGKIKPGLEPVFAKIAKTLNTTSDNKTEAPKDNVQKADETAAKAEKSESPNKTILEEARKDKKEAEPAIKKVEAVKEDAKDATLTESEKAKVGDSIAKMDATAKKIDENKEKIKIAKDSIKKKKVVVRKDTTKETTAPVATETKQEQKAEPVTEQKVETPTEKDVETTKKEIVNTANEILQGELELSRNEKTVSKTIASAKADSVQTELKAIDKAINEIEATKSKNEDVNKKNARVAKKLKAKKEKVLEASETQGMLFDLDTKEAKEENVRFQNAINDESIKNDKEFNPFYEDYVYKKNGKYLVDAELLAKTITRVTNGKINRSKANFVAKIISLMPKNALNDIMVKNGGRLILSADESGIDLGENYRGAALLDSAQIILSDKSDASTILHESFHLLLSVDNDLKTNLFETFKTVLNSEKERAELIDFVKDNENLFGRKAVEVMKSFDLLKNGNLTEEQMTEVEETITSAYEGWFLRGQGKGLSNSVKNIFRKVAEMFNEIYHSVTGKSFLPESIDVAFVATIDTSNINETKASNTFQGYTNIKTIPGMVMDDDPAVRASGLEKAANTILSVVSDSISDVLNGSDIATIKDAIINNEKVKKYLESFPTSARDAVSAEIEKRLNYIAQSPTVFARNFNTIIKKLEDSIDKGQDKASQKNAEEVLKVISNLWDNVRRKSSKSKYIYDSDNTQDIGIRRMVSIKYKGLDVGELYDGLVNSMKAKGKVDRTFTPEEVLAMARALVNKDGSVVLDKVEHDGVESNILALNGTYRAPLITMLNYMVTDKTDIAEIKASSFLDKGYIDMSNLLITVMQSPNVQESYTINQDTADVAEFLDTLGVDNWVNYIADSEDGMEIVSTIAEQFRGEIAKIGKKIATISKQNKETSSNLDEMEKNLDKISKEMSKRRNATDENTDLKNKMRSLNSQLKKEIEKNVGLEALKKQIEADPDYNDLQEMIKALKYKLDLAKKKIDSLQQGNDPRIAKLQEEIALLKDTDAYKDIMAMQTKVEDYYKQLHNTSRGGDARIAKGLEEILDALSKHGTKKGTKIRLFDFNRFVNDTTYYGILDFMLTNGMLQEVTLADGTKGYNIVRGYKNLSIDEISDFVDLFTAAKKRGLEIQKQKKAEKEAQLRKQEAIIVNSLKGLKNIPEDKREQFVADYMASIRPGSETYERANKKNPFQKGLAGVTLTTKLVQHLSPALYSYMYGGLVDGEYNNYNLNSQTNKENTFVKNRTKGFMEAISKTFGIEEKDIKYSLTKLFNKKTSTIGYADDVETFFKDNMGDERVKALYDYREQLEKERTAIQNSISDMEDAIANAEDGVDVEALLDMISEKNERLNQIGYVLDSDETSPAEYTMEDLMGIYIYSQSNDGLVRLMKSDKEDVITQNLTLRNVIWVMDNFLSNDEYSQYREISDWIMDDVGSRFDEMSEVYYQTENKVLKEEDMYFPISALQATFDNSATMKLDAFFSDRGYVNERDTKERTGARNALNLDVIDSYMSAVKRQEHYIAFKELTDNYTELFKKDGKVAQAIMAMYEGKSGKGAQTVQQLNDYLDIIKGIGGNVDDVSSIVAKIRNNFVISKLWGNLSTVLQQFPTYLLVAKYVGWGDSVRYLRDYISNGKNRSEFIYQMSPQMRDRARLDIETYRNQRSTHVSDLERWVESKAGKDLLGDAKINYSKFIDFGLSFMENADTAIANAMWWAIYNKNLEEYSMNPDLYMKVDENGNKVSFLEQAAADDATQKVMDVSPNQNPKDNSLLYSKKDVFWKQFFLFTNQLNKQFNMIYGDIMDFEFSDDWKEKVKPLMQDLLVLGVVSVGAALISGAPYPDEEEDWKDFFGELAGNTLAEMAGNIPYGGSLIKGFATGDSYTDTNILEQLANVRKVLSKDPDTRTSHQMSRAIVNFLAEAGTLFGVPSTAAQKTYRTIIEFMDSPSVGDLGYLLNTKTGNFYSRVAED